MATQQQFNGTGYQTDFVITLFEFLQPGDINIKVGTDVQESPSNYSIEGTTIKFTSAPASGTNNITAERVTNIATKAYTYEPGSSITAQSLNDNQNQALYSIEENAQNAVTTTTLAGNKSTITVSTDNVTWSINDNVIDNQHLKDNAVDTSEIKQNAVTANEIADNAVDTGAIADNAVTMAKLGSGALPTDITVASANLVNGTIATVDIADSAVTTAKMAATRFFGSYAVLQDVKSHGTDGQNLVNDAWYSRDLNTESIDPDGIILGLDNKATSGNLKAASPNGTGGNYSTQPAANNFTLGAGTYLIKWNTTFWRTARCKSRLIDKTNPAIKAVSMNVYSNRDASYASVNSHGIARITTTGNTDYALEYNCDNEADSKGGGIKGSGDTSNTEEEVYTTIEIYKEL